MKNKKLLIIIAVLVAVIAIAIPLYNSLSSEYTASNMMIEETQEQAEIKDDNTQKTLAPDFTVYDINGNAVNLSDFRGKPTIVNFWASWCGPCKSEMPSFEKVYKEYGSDINFLMINLTDNSRETVKTASAYINNNGFSFPVFYDTDLDGAYTYDIYSVPTTFFIDKDGYVIAYASGAIDEASLKNGITLIK